MFDDYDYVIHCGDYGTSSMKNIIYVKGNCDLMGDKEHLLNINDIKFYITHGDMYNVKYTYQSLYYKAMEVNCRVCLFGHTHKQTYFKENDIIFINPGAYCNGEYCIISDNKITFFSDKKILEEFEVMW